MDNCDQDRDNIVASFRVHDIEAVIPVDRERRVSLNPAGFDVINNNKEYILHCCDLSDKDPDITINQISRDPQKKFESDQPCASAYDDEASSISFSFRKLWAFTGPGLWAGVGYMDPGSIESDLQSGTVAKYQLLWVLLWSTIIGILMQRLAVRLGIVSGLHLAQVCHREFPTVPRVILWLLAEVAVLGAEIQGLIGSTIALYLLSNKSIPLWAGVLIAAGQSSILLHLEKLGMRKMEAVFAFMITVMAASFGYEFIKVAPSKNELLSGMFLPACKNCDKNAFFQGIGIVGAVIMPHNLFLHSTLVTSKASIDRSKPSQVKEASKYLFIESSITLVISYVINLLIVSVFANGMWNEMGTLRKSNKDILQLCHQSEGQQRERDHNYYANLFENNTKIFEPTIYTGGIYLGCQYGNVAKYIWAIGVLAAGQTNAMTATYTGQSIMEGFLNLNSPPWRRLVITRLIVVLPTFLIAAFLEIKSLSGMNDMLNALMSMLLPFALLPLVSATCNEDIMGKFKNGGGIKLLSCTLAIILIAINLYFVSCFFHVDNVSNSTAWYATLGKVTFGIFYISLSSYLFCHAVLSMGFPGWSKEAVAYLLIVVVVNIAILMLAAL